MNWHRKIDPAIWVSIVLLVAAAAVLGVAKPVHHDLLNWIGNALMWLGMWFWGYWQGRAKS